MASGVESPNTANGVKEAGNDGRRENMMSSMIPCGRSVNSDLDYISCFHSNLGGHRDVKCWDARRQKRKRLEYENKVNVTKPRRWNNGNCCEYPKALELTPENLFLLESLTSSPVNYSNLNLSQKAYFPTTPYIDNSLCGDVEGIEKDSANSDNKSYNNHNLGKGDFFWKIKEQANAIRRREGKKITKTAHKRAELRFQRKKEQCRTAMTLVDVDISDDSESTDSSIDSVRGIVNGMNDVPHINMCDNPSDLWYGLKMMNGQPVEMHQVRIPRKKQRRMVNNRFKSCGIAPTNNSSMGLGSCIVGNSRLLRKNDKGNESTKNRCKIHHGKMVRRTRNRPYIDRFLKSRNLRGVGSSHRVSHDVRVAVDYLDGNLCNNLEDRIVSSLDNYNSSKSVFYDGKLRSIISYLDMDSVNVAEFDEVSECSSSNRRHKQNSIKEFNISLDKVNSEAVVAADRRRIKVQPKKRAESKVMHVQRILAKRRGLLF